MSNVFLRVGFLISEDEILNTFSVTEGKDAYEEEPRYDQFTGNKIKSVKKLVSTEKQFLVYGKIKTDITDSLGDCICFVDSLAKKLKCKATFYGDNDMETNYVFHLKNPKEINTGVHYSYNKIQGSLKISDIEKLKQPLEELKIRIEETGLKPKEPMVVLCWAQD